MKRFLATILVLSLCVSMGPLQVIAETYDYGTVNITLEALSTEEDIFRKWAADIIEEYYNEYCNHDEHDSKATKAFRNFTFPKNDNTSNQEVVTGYNNGYFDGLYRDYYFASIAKWYYDMNVQKSKYQVNNIYKKTEDYEKYMLPFYKSLIVDIMEESSVIDMDSLGNINPRKAGRYTLKKNEATGKMVMQLDENGKFDVLDKMATAEVVAAYEEFGIGLLSVGFDAMNLMDALDSENLEKEGFNVQKAVLKSFQRGVIQLCKDFTGELGKRTKSVLEYNMKEAIRCSAANQRLLDYNRIMEYLDNVYKGQEPQTARFGTDRIFLSAAKECLEEMEEKYGPKAQQEIANWSVEDIAVPKILMMDEIFVILVIDLVDNVMTQFESFLSDACKYVYGHDPQTNVFVAALIQTIVAVMKEQLLAEAEKLINNIYYGMPTESKPFFESVKQRTNGSVESALTTFCDVVGEKFDSEKLLGGTGKMASGVAKAVVGELETIIKFRTKMEKGELVQADFDALYNSFENIGIALISATSGKIIAKQIKVRCKNLTGKVTDAMITFFEAVSALLKSCVSAGESLAKATHKLVNKLCENDATDYRSVAMFVAYKASLTLEVEMYESLKGYIEKYKDLHTAIVETKIVTVKELLEWINKIGLQVKYDIVGSQWLFDILAIGERKEKDCPAFYRFLLGECTENTVWSGLLTTSKEGGLYGKRTKMVYFDKNIKNGFKESYSKLAS